MKPEAAGWTNAELQSFVDECEFGGYNFFVRPAHGGIVLYASYVEPDIRTGKDSVQSTRKWLLSPYMTKSEVVQTAFKCILTSMEHRAREGFKYRGKRVFGPHFDVDALHEICKDRRFDVRDDQ